MTDCIPKIHMYHNAKCECHLLRNCQCCCIHLRYHQPQCYRIRYISLFTWEIVSHLLNETVIKMERMCQSFINCHIKWFIQIYIHVVIHTDVWVRLSHHILTVRNVSVNRQSTITFNICRNSKLHLWLFMNSSVLCIAMTYLNDWVGRESRRCACSSCEYDVRLPNVMPLYKLNSCGRTCSMTRTDI